MDNALIILNYNDYETTIELINLIKNYNSIDLIVIVDNASTDNSYDKLKNYETKKINVIKTPHNGGYGYGNNFGFKYAFDKGASYIGIANPDIEFSEECFTKLVEYLFFNKDCGVVAPISLNIRGNESKNLAWKQPNIFFETITSSVILNRIFFYKTHYNKKYLHSGCSIDVDILPGSFLFFNAKYFYKIGMFDENVFLYCEEKILGWKFKEKKIDSKLLTDINYIHKHSISIDKNIKSHYKKTKLWLNSKKYFLTNYMSKKVISIFFVNLFFLFSQIEALSIEIYKILEYKFKKKI